MNAIGFSYDAWLEAPFQQAEREAERLSDEDEAYWESLLEAGPDEEAV